MKPILTDDDQYYLKAMVTLSRWELEFIEEERNRPRTKVEKVFGFIRDAIAIVFAIAVVSFLVMVFTWN